MAQGQLVPDPPIAKLVRRRSNCAISTLRGSLGLSPTICRDSSTDPDSGPLVAAGADPNTTLVLLTCNPEPFATRYRFRMRNGALPGSKFEIVASTKAALAQASIPQNAPMEFIAHAVNGNRQSVASDAVVFTAPLADAARPETIAPLAASAPEVSKNGNSKTNGNGNGNSNGNGNGNRAVASRLS